MSTETLKVMLTLPQLTTEQLVDALKYTNETQQGEILNELHRRDFDAAWAGGLFEFIGREWIKKQYSAASEVDCARGLPYLRPVSAR
jgi:hypothetical protein